MYWTVLVKRELNLKAKLSIYQSMFQPLPTAWPSAFGREKKIPETGGQNPLYSIMNVYGEMS